VVPPSEPGGERAVASSACITPRAWAVLRARNGPGPVGEPDHFVEYPRMDRVEATACWRSRLGFAFAAAGGASPIVGMWQIGPYPLFAQLPLLYSTASPGLSCHRSVWCQRCGPSVAVPAFRCQRSPAAAVGRGLRPAALSVAGGPALIPAGFWLLPTPHGPLCCRLCRRSPAPEGLSRLALSCLPCNSFVSSNTAKTSQGGTLRAVVSVLWVNVI
jgi:hypothetical protein